MAKQVIVITGGNDGIGLSLALSYVKKGWQVITIGRNAVKGSVFLQHAKEYKGEAKFIQADLSVVSENKRVVNTLKSTLPKIDALVFCARYFRSQRKLTIDGLEENFALGYLSRHLFSYELRDLLEQSGNPVIVNVSGPGGEMSLVNWSDLQLEQNYSGVAALFQTGKLNDLLGVYFAKQFASGKTKYILYHPGVTATSFTGDYTGDEEVQAIVEKQKQTGKPVSEAADPILKLIDNQPIETLTAFVLNETIPVNNDKFDIEAAERLKEITKEKLVQFDSLENSKVDTTSSSEKAYVVSVLTKLKDINAMIEYSSVARETLAKYGGKMVRSGEEPFINLEGAALSISVVEFLSKEVAKEWYYSKEYQETAELRKKGADCLVFIID